MPGAHAHEGYCEQRFIFVTGVDANTRKMFRPKKVFCIRVFILAIGIVIAIYATVATLVGAPKRYRSSFNIVCIHKNTINLQCCTTGYIGILRMTYLPRLFSKCNHSMEMAPRTFLHLYQPNLETKVTFGPYQRKKE